MKTNLIFQKAMCLIFLCIGLISCDSSVNTETEGSSNIEALISRSLISSDGNVRSSENLPIEGVTVKRLGNIIATSDGQGNFIIKGEMLQEGDILTFEHTDFITVTKVLNTNSSLSIFMKRRAASKIIDSRRGGVVALEKGGGIRIPANAFSFREQPYTGPVKITASYIDVTDENEVRSAPGSYIAFDEVRNNLVPLTSFGMIEINAVNPIDNELLELTKGSSIEIAFPILTPDTPNTVNLYELDTDIGYWVLVGELQTEQNMLLGEITTVNGALNADEPCSDALICVKVKVLTFEGYPTSCDLSVIGLSYQAGSSGSYYVDSESYVEFLVCPDSTFEIQACTYAVVLGDEPTNFTKTIDLSEVTMNPNGCTDLGVWVLPEVE